MGSSRSKLAGMADCVVIEPTGQHTATVIFLHGLGDTGNGWSSVFSAISQPHVKYVFPTAPVIPVTLNGGLRMNAWFDIIGLSPLSAEDEAGIKSAADLLQQLIANEEKAGISRSRIVVGGFSQGGAVALYSALAYDTQPLAGILALSTWLPLNKQFPQYVKANVKTPVLQCHGTSDPVVPFTFGQLTSRALQGVLQAHELTTYQGMGHSSNDKEIEDVKAFLLKNLPPL